MNPQGSPLQRATGASGEADTRPVLRVADRLESFASPARSISAGHAQLLHSSAIDVEVAREAGVYSVLTAADLPPAFRGYDSKIVPALAFSYAGLSGDAVPQLRPERPWKGAEGSQAKYLFPSGESIPMTVHPRMRSSVLDRTQPLVVVEGTKQYLAAVSALGADDAVAIGDEAASGPAPVQRTGMPATSDSCDSSFTPTPTELPVSQEGDGGGEGGVKSVTTVTAFDLETADADQLFTYQPHDSQGFVRLAAWNGRVTPDVGEMLRALDEADEIVGHNIIGYDLQVLAHHHDADYRKLAAKSRDTLILARLADPPVSRQTGQAQRSYGLDALARDKLGQEKTAELEALRRLHGGYDRIPVDRVESERFRSFGHDEVFAWSMEDLDDLPAPEVIGGRGPLSLYCQMVWYCHPFGIAPGLGQ